MASSSSGSSPSSDSAASPSTDKKRPGMRQLFREYGVPFAAYLTGAYIVTGAAAWVGVGIVGEEVAHEAVTSFTRDTLQWKWAADQLDGLDPRLGRLAVAVAINEVLEIVRLPFVLATFPALRRAWLRRQGRQ